MSLQALILSIELNTKIIYCAGFSTQNWAVPFFWIFLAHFIILYLLISTATEHLYKSGIQDRQNKVWESDSNMLNPLDPEYHFCRTNTWEIVSGCVMLRPTFVVGRLWCWVPTLWALTSRPADCTLQTWASTHWILYPGGLEKQRWEESERRRKVRRPERKEDAGARKGRKVAIHCVFPMIWGSGGSKSRLAKAAGAEPCGQMRH